MIDDQQAFFKVLREQVGSLVRAKKSGQEVRDSIEKIRAELAGSAQIARYVSLSSLPSQVEKVYTEMTGQQLPESKKTAQDTRLWHAHAHGLERLA
jgi:hypothetical protein